MADVRGEASICDLLTRGLLSMGDFLRFLRAPPAPSLVKKLLMRLELCLMKVCVFEALTRFVPSSLRIGEIEGAPERLWFRAFRLGFQSIGSVEEMSN